MYTVMVDSHYPFSFVNEDSAYRFTHLVLDDESEASFEEKKLYESCEDAMIEYRKLRDAQKQIAFIEVEMDDDSHKLCHFQSYDPKIIPCMIDAELLCSDCEYWK